MTNPYAAAGLSDASFDRMKLDPAFQLPDGSLDVGRALMSETETARAVVSNNAARLGQIPQEFIGAMDTARGQLASRQFTEFWDTIDAHVPLVDGLSAGFAVFPQLLAGFERCKGTLQTYFQTAVAPLATVLGPVTCLFVVDVLLAEYADVVRQGESDPESRAVTQQRGANAARERGYATLSDFITASAERVRTAMRDMSGNYVLSGYVQGADAIRQRDAVLGGFSWNSSPEGRRHELLNVVPSA